MSDGSSWVPPTENTIPSLLHGMRFVDGVEFDLRLSADGELMLFHDDLLPGSEAKRDRCVELLDSVEVASRGIDRFDDAKNIKKNQALTAILAHIDTGKRPNVTRYLQNKILAEIPKTAIEERKAMKKRIKDAQTGVGVNKDGETLFESLTK